MKKYIPQADPVSIGDMTVRQAIEEALDLQTKILANITHDPELVQTAEKKTLLKWYRDMIHAVIDPISKLSDLRIDGGQKQAELQKLGDKLLGNAYLTGGQITKTAIAFSVQQDAIRATLRPIRERLAEIEAMCLDIAKCRGYNFRPSLPLRKQALLDKIVTDQSIH